VAAGFVSSTPGDVKTPVFTDAELRAAYCPNATPPTGSLLMRTGKTNSVHRLKQCEQRNISRSYFIALIKSWPVE